MWCAHCQADVAAEISSDGQALLCTTCGTEIRKVYAPSLHPETRSARELLERWTSGELLDPYGPLPRHEAPADDAAPGDASGRSAGRSGAGDPTASNSKRKPQFRVDAAHGTPLQAAGPKSLDQTPDRRSVARALPQDTRLDSGHQEVPPPHFDVQQPIQPPARQPGKGEALWGQLLAYGGVGLLTIGTALVLWGYFGGPATYAPTGWLITTAGQMLLFLGVVTLVSGGMQQTTHEVAARVEYLGNRMIRIEQSTRDLLRGPHFGASREGDAERQAQSADDSAAL